MFVGRLMVSYSLLIKLWLLVMVGFPGGAVIKNPPANAGDTKRCEFDPWVGKIPWSRKWQPLQYSCLENSMGRGTWMSYSPWGHKELDTTE